MSDHTKRCLIIVLIFLPLCYFLLAFRVGKPLIFKGYYEYIDKKYGNYSARKCEIQYWNSDTTTALPDEKTLRELGKKKEGSAEGLDDGELRLLAAYLYRDEIVVTTTRQRFYETGNTIHCRYYDCNREEIPGSNFSSLIFPMTAVHCVKRRGAQYISLSFEPLGNAPKPIPFVKRLDEKPPHDVGVCVGQIYGAEKKWMEVVEFVEHHKIIGVTMFYFTTFQMEAYSRTLLDDYVRTGYAEVTHVNTEYTDGYVFLHMIQIYDCFFRARHHSKWMLNIDHDEFLVPNRKTFFEYVDSLSSRFAEIIFAVRLINKEKNGLDVYNTTDEVVQNLQMTKYNQTVSTIYLNGKVMVQPTKVNAMQLHFAKARLPGYRAYAIPKSMAYVAHYRNRHGWLPNFETDHFATEGVDRNHTDVLKLRVAETVENVFKKHNITCDSISNDWKRVTQPLLKKMHIC